MKSEFKLFILSLFAVSLITVGCGDKSEGDDAKTDSTATSEEVAPSGGSASVADFKAGMIELSKQMIEVAEDVETVADAEAAEPKVEKAMTSIASLFTGLADNIDKMTLEELKGLQDMQNIGEDPEVKKWMDQAEAAMDKLKADHPEAAAKLKEIGEKHSQKMMGAMMGAMMKIGQKVGMDNMGGGEAMPGEGDSASGK
ncbi:MAG: hypothetical protein KDD67_15395 [Ignavibacteriae bacterium]|nr:hypothetical protein [Ignavibacteriota bacterium]MCB9215793.1 hypothetical protein [Ignavibacteria bacterium]